MAFGITVSVSRVGSVVNFLATEQFAEAYGFTATLWGGSVFCAIGLLSSIILGIMDTYGTKQLGVADVMKQESKQMDVGDIKQFSGQYWLMSTSIMFYYASTSPFCADSTKFIHDKYNISKVDSAAIAGAIYYISVVFSPIIGFIVDRFGKRGIITIAIGLLTFPVMVLFPLTSIHPLVLTCWLGVFYVLAAVCMWSVLPFLVPRKSFGLAVGITTFMQAGMVAVFTVVVGTILGQTNSLPDDELMSRWKVMFIPLAASALASSMAGIVLNVVEAKKGGSLNKAHMTKSVSLAEYDKESHMPIFTKEPAESDRLLQNSEPAVN